MKTTQTIFHVLFSLLIAVAFSVACGTAHDVEVEMTKEKAQAVDNWWGDFCEIYGWYGDGICDTFCPQPDPDCQPDHPTDHRPFCGHIGTAGEGWYWGDTEQLIKKESCADYAEPGCLAIGTEQEGWHSTPGLIVFDNCHQTVGLSLAEEVCQGDTGLSCYTSAPLDPNGFYCLGGDAETAGVCRLMGSCDIANNCLDEANIWNHPMCMGRAACEDNQCVWHCGFVHPTDHRPYCDGIGTDQEGWYWGDTEELIVARPCADLPAPECDAIGTRSEGWFSTDHLIVYDRCHQLVRIAITGEACGPSIGFTCADHNYCKGLPQDQRGGSGICRLFGFCEEVTDCQAPDNNWSHPDCEGFASCNEEYTCTWTCQSQNTGPWSWTTHLLADVESEHPYDNNYQNTWSIHKPGAESIKIFLHRYEIERNYDSLTFAGNREESALILDGSGEDYWTPAISGDTLDITLATDYSVTKWGFQATSISYYEQLPQGLCNDHNDCENGLMCHPHRCINPYAPCYGECIRDNHCDDGSTPMCEIIPPACTNGLILAHQNNCYRCVDTDTCLPPEEPISRVFSNNASIEIPDNNSQGVVSEIDVDEQFNCTPQLILDATIRHTYAGDLVVSLEEPTGNTHQLWNRQGGSADDIIIEGLDLTGQMPQGRANGIWKLKVSDHANLDTGLIESWTLSIACL